MKAPSGSVKPTLRSALLGLARFKTGTGSYPARGRDWRRKPPVGSREASLGFHSVPQPRPDKTSVVGIAIGITRATGTAMSTRMEQRKTKAKTKRQGRLQ